MPADLTAVERVRTRFLAGDAGTGDPGRQLEELVAQEMPLLDRAGVSEAAAGLARDLLGMGTIEVLLDDPDITDVLVNGPGEVWVERAGRLESSGLEVDRSEILRMIDRQPRPISCSANR